MENKRLGSIMIFVEALIVIFLIIGFLFAMKAQKAVIPNGFHDEAVATTTIVTPVIEKAKSEVTVSEPAKPVEIQYTNIGFVPDLIVLSPGSHTIVIRNKSQAPLKIASDPHPGHDDFLALNQLFTVKPGESYFFAFPPGHRVYHFHNELGVRHSGTVVAN